MELSYFLHILNKRKWLIFAIMLLAAIVTFFYVGRLPKRFKTGAIISAGIIDYKGLRIDQNNVFMQEYEIENKFSNLIEYLKSKPSMNIVTRELMKHDLLAANEKEAFRTLNSTEKAKFSKKDIENYIKRLNEPIDSLAKNNFDGSYAVNQELEKAFEYDDMSLREKMDIKRLTKTDFLRFEFDSENPKLSYFVLKSYIDGFFDLYYSKQDTQVNRAVSFYERIASQKKGILDSLTLSYNNYKQNNAIVALDEQSSSIVTQLKELEIARSNEEQKVASYSAAKQNLEEYKNKFTKIQVEDFSKSLFNNQEMQLIVNQIFKLESQYVDGGMKDVSLQKKIVELKAKQLDLSRVLAKSTRKENDILDDKEKEYFGKYVDAETNLKMSSQSLNKINDAIGQIRGEKGKLVKDNAIVNIIGNQLEIARKEYEHYVDLRNAADLNKKSVENPLKVIEYPIMPLKPESSKRAMLSSFAAIATGTLTLLFLFFMSYFESSPSSPQLLKRLTGVKTIGVLNHLSNKSNNNLNQLFDQYTNQKDAEYFKESIRRIRSEIEHSDCKSFLFVSPKEQEGKSLIIATLAHVFMIKNAKVLIIDTNFKNNTLTQLSNSASQNQTLNSQGVSAYKSSDLGFQINLDKIDIIGNKGGHNSPSELLAGVDFKKKLEKLATTYDYIFFEAAALNNYSDARELIDYVDKLIIVFDAKNKINRTDTEALTFAKNSGTKLLGAILNKVDLKNIL